MFFILLISFLFLEINEIHSKPSKYYDCTKKSCANLDKFQKCLKDPKFNIQEHPNCALAAWNTIQTIPSPRASTVPITGNSDASLGDPGIFLPKFETKVLPDSLVALLKEKAPWMLPEVRTKEFFKTHNPDLNVLPGKPVLICSFDGGGVKGLIPATILADIEKEVSHPITEICDIFVGTSTGGLIALFLTVPDDHGRQKYTALHMVDLYKSLAKEVFQKSWRKGIFVSKYSENTLMKLLYRYVGNNRVSDAKKPLVVTAHDLKSKSNFVIATRYGILYPKMDLPMMYAGRATSAAPTFFPPLDLSLGEGIQLKLVDGGLMANNPSLLALMEAEQVYPGRSYVILSLGTGEYTDLKAPKKSGIVSMLKPTVEALFSGPMQLTHDVIRGSIPKENYYRFSPRLNKKQDAMDNVSDDNIASLEEIAKREILSSSSYKNFVERIKKELILKKYLEKIVDFIDNSKSDAYINKIKELDDKIQSYIKENNKDLEKAYKAKNYFQKQQILLQANLISDLSIRKAFVEWIINAESGFEWALEGLDGVKSATLGYMQSSDHKNAYDAFMKNLRNPSVVVKNLVPSPSSLISHPISLQKEANNLNAPASNVIPLKPLENQQFAPKRMSVTGLSPEVQADMKSNFHHNRKLWEARQQAIAG